MENAAKVATEGVPVEPEYERLIKIIQNRETAVPKEQREEALLKLIHLFRFLIKKIAHSVWRPATGERRDDFEHDTITTFLELVVEDYIPRAYGGAAHFAPYIQRKLYYKMLYKAQQLVRHNSRMKPTDFSNEYSDMPGSNFRFPNTDGGYGSGRGLTTTIANNHGSMGMEIREAVMAMTFDTSLENQVIADMRDADMQKQLLEIIDIAQKVLEPREMFVWDKYFFSDMMVKDIGDQLDPKIGTSRVNQIVGQARRKVLEELGRRRLGSVLK